MAFVFLSHLATTSVYLGNNTATPATVIANKITMRNGDRFRSRNMDQPIGVNPERRMTRKIMATDRDNYPRS